MSFTRSLWSSIEPIHARILEHPFLRGMTDGSLDPASFRHYAVQDSLYLRDFGRGLAVLGARADDDDALAMFCNHAANAIAVERALHEGFFSAWGLTPQDVEGTPPTPTTLLYTSYLMRVAYERPYAEGVAAFLPCYWIYWEVGKALEAKGSPDPLYQQWIDTYAGEEFAAVVEEVLALTDRIAAGRTDAQRERMRAHFVTTSRFEWMFWDAGYARQEWPV